MTMTAFWGMIIRVRWFKPAWFSPAWFISSALCCLPLLHGAEPPVVRLGQGVTDYRAEKYPAAVQDLKGLALPVLSDYLAYHLAAAQEQTGDFDGAIQVLYAYRQAPVASTPLSGRISLLTARVMLEKQTAALSAKAVQILESDYKTLPQPEGDALLASAYAFQKEYPQAVLVYRRVYYGYPNTKQAAEAWTALERIRVEQKYELTKVPARQQLERCEKWLAAKEYGKARAEYDVLSKSLPEPERDEAKVGLGAADYLSGNVTVALRYLKALHVAKSDADAQRLYYATEAARKTGDEADMMAFISQLGQKYPKSPWRLKALITAGNRYLVINDKSKYTPLYRTASEAFPGDPATAYCHWKVAWEAYLDGHPEAATLLRNHVEQYPADGKTSTALYFLGRLAEYRKASTEAKAYYDRLSLQFPHYFYGVDARERIAVAKLSAVVPDPAVKAWLDQIAWPPHRDLSATEPNPATKLRMERTRLLSAANLQDLAEAEVRFGVKLDSEQPQLLAMELARTADSSFRALRVMKSFSADYLAIPLDSAPKKFWQMLFPLPYKEEVFQYAKANGLDPYAVAALIRQESEFNPQALSRARAYGLMQLIFSTGKLMGKREGVAVATPKALFNASLNIRLGTKYLKGQLDNWGGEWEKTLAAYNAGPGRVKEWTSWATYREPAEFVESIPFTETREYVQAVLRNADMYRQIYGGSKPEPPTPAAARVPVPEYGAVAAPVGKAASAAPSTKATAAPSKKKKTVPHKTVRKNTDS